MNNSRRAFMKTSAAAGIGFWTAGGLLANPWRSANEEIRFACIGVGGKGTEDSTNVSKLGKIVAICDIDDSLIGKKQQEEAFRKAAVYNDYRKMFDEMGDQIDAVTISTPDHTHAVIALEAMRAGKHVYCQKPLTHSIEESRLLGQVAKETGVITQMGNQYTAHSNLRQSAALIRKGIIGKVREVHAWTNRPVWPQSLNLKVKEPPVPSHVHWNEWIGPAKHRPYSPEIHQFKWRGFWDFGTGALGDMACHTLNMSYMALDLKFPTSVEATASEHDGVCYPAASEIVFEFPALGDRDALKVFWYDGGKRPPRELFDGAPKKVNNESGRKYHYTTGAILVGEKGNYFSPGDYGEIPKHTGMLVDGEFIRQRTIVRPRDENRDAPFSEFKDIEFQRSPGQYTEFANAIKGNGKTVSEFVDYAGPLSETILLGNLALHSGKKVIWDAKKMIAQDASEATQKIVRHDYHNGYSIHQPATAQ